MLDVTSSVTRMFPKIANDGISTWNAIVVKKALDQFRPKSDNSQKRQQNERIPEAKLQAAIFDIMRTQIDNLILANQIKRLHELTQEFMSDFSVQVEKSAEAYRPSFNSRDDTKLFEPASTMLFIVKPRDADRQFNEEVQYANAVLLNLVSSALYSSTLERKEHEGTCSAVFSGDAFEANCHVLSHAFRLFWDNSLADLNLTWWQYLAR